MSGEDDRRFMQRAIELARQGEGCASPNPLVGAVLVLNGEVVGEGFHTYVGVKHAEMIALEQAGAQARGATLYCSLEPCCHFGRTSPCTDALIEAGISRAVIAIVDNDIRVSGRGIEQLRRDGIMVIVGVCQEEAFDLNRQYFEEKSQSVPRKAESPST